MTEIEELQQRLWASEERNKELEQDVRDFAYVTHEILGVFGITVDDLVNDRVKFSTVMKSMKSKILQVTIDPDGFASLMAHFQNEAIRVGLKYKDMAVEESLKRKN